MNQLKLRAAVPDDTKQVVDWINANPRNLFDPDILNYPTLRVICAYDKEPVAYLPTQQALFLESVAMNPNPALNPYRAQALRDLTKGAQLLASTNGIKEIYMFGADEAVINIAQDHGFERIPWPLLRLKL